ncbi:aspartate aminotransferase family protein [Dermatobacter hominis]|uniref:aspartate aminotransferase family protein n=1 Tax=Dermatobacter hominis TaxID=2884263 RepID=UPI001D117C61|nr:aspartate aminotransferase family protein [Dermatobacter hominis]UDY35308.1 aspartate aminotransferase family protein [Dermatobacter hominis]
MPVPTSDTGAPTTDLDPGPTAAASPFWGHFTAMSSTDELPVMVRGEGCYVWDRAGNRYLDGLSGLFTVQVGHGRRDLAAAASEQMSTLAYFPIWSYATEPALALAERLTGMAPGDLNRVFFTTGGSEAVDTAWKLARQYFKAVGQPNRTKVISRNLAYHGTTFGALSITGLPGIKEPFEPLVPGAVKVRHTNPFRSGHGFDEEWAELCARDIDERIRMEGPDTVAAVYLEPVQNTGGTIPPPPGYFRRVREICDHHGVLLVSDEVICAFGRLGHWFGADRFDYRPDMITFAKGVTSGYSPLGGVLVSDRLAQPFIEAGSTFLHGITFGGHPVSCAVAMANLDVLEHEDVLGNVRRRADGFRERLEGLRDLPIVGDVRGDGFLRTVELVRDPDTLDTFTDEESAWLLKGQISHRLFELGLMCRADDRSDPMIILSPPLIAGDAELDLIESVLRTVLVEAWDSLRAR